MRHLQGHANQVSALVFAADGQHFYSSSEDATVKIWNWMTATCLTTITIDRPYEGMNIMGIQGLTAAQKTILRTLGAKI
jgi:WD40 repeat protein